MENLETENLGVLWKSSYSNYSKATNDDDKRQMRYYTDTYSDLYKNSENELSELLPGITQSEREALIRQNYKCFYTGEVIYDGGDNYIGSIDHIYPASLGGLIVPENIILTTRDINTDRGSKRAQDYVTERFEKGLIHNGGKTKEELISELDKLNSDYQTKFPEAYKVYEILSSGEPLMPLEFCQAFPGLPVVSNNITEISKFHPDKVWYNEFRDKIINENPTLTCQKYLNLIGKTISSNFPNKSIREIEEVELEQLYNSILNNISNEVNEIKDDYNNGIPMNIRSALISIKEFFIYLGRDDFNFKLIEYSQKYLTKNKNLNSIFRNYCFGNFNTLKSNSDEYRKFNTAILELQTTKGKIVENFNDDEVFELFELLKAIKNNSSTNIAYSKLSNFIELLPENIQAKKYLLDTNTELIEKIGLSEDEHQNYLKDREQINTINQSDNSSAIIKEEDILNMYKYKKYPVKEYVNYLFNKVIEDNRLKEKSFKALDDTVKTLKIFNNKENFIKILNIVFDNKSEDEMKYLSLALQKKLIPSNIIADIQLEKLESEF